MHVSVWARLKEMKDKATKWTGAQEMPHIILSYLTTLSMRSSISDRSQRFNLYKVNRFHNKACDNRLLGLYPQSDHGNSG